MIESINRKFSESICTKARASLALIVFIGKLIQKNMNSVNVSLRLLILKI
jgi:hypothetical protein